MRALLGEHPKILSGPPLTDTDPSSEHAEQHDADSRGPRCERDELWSDSIRGRMACQQQILIMYPEFPEFQNNFVFLNSKGATRYSQIGFDTSPHCRPLRPFHSS